MLLEYVAAKLIATTITVVSDIRPTPTLKRDKVKVVYISNPSSKKNKKL